MNSLAEIHTTNELTPIDYLVIGHIAKDQTPQGATIGGTAAYAGRTAHAHGFRTGLLTSYAADIDLRLLQGMQIRNVPSQATTTFENRYAAQGREQILCSVARPINPDDVPQVWQQTPIVHLGPIANEVNRELIQHFSDAFIGITPQGWLREWGEDGKVHLLDWTAIRDILPLADAVVISLEDLGHVDQAVSTIAQECQLLIVTDGANGAWVHFQGQQRHFPAPRLDEVDPTGAGDIFAAAYFIHFNHNQDPWEAACVATDLAAKSVTRTGIGSTPSKEEVQRLRAEVRR
jgi:sugar/nucleoside kinase (ribokinase family)